MEFDRRKNDVKYSFMERETLNDSLNYQEYLMAMRDGLKRGPLLDPAPVEEIISPRRRRQNASIDHAMKEESMKPEEAIRRSRIKVIASMVPDEIIYQNTNTSIRSYESALMFVDVSGFTELCEYYTKADRGGTSRFTQVLNSYIGSMIQEIMMYNGDVLQFSGDAFLAMWKIIPRISMRDIVHTAIDCGLIIQKNYGTLVTDGGIVLKVKVAISAGVSYFSLIGGGNVSQSHYVIVGQPVWDVKAAQYLSTAGDVITSASVWKYVNEAEYCTQLSNDRKHTKVLGVGATWKGVEKIDAPPFASKEFISPNASMNIPTSSGSRVMEKSSFNFSSTTTRGNFREYSLRPAMIAAMQGDLGEELRRFMVTPVLLAVDNDEPMDFLTEVRRVVVIFINIITVSVTDDVLIDIVNKAFSCVCSEASVAGGIVNKVSMFDKDLMFLVIFGLRGLKHEDETEKALMCASQLKLKLIDPNIMSVSVAVTSEPMTVHIENLAKTFERNLPSTSYCGVVGHILRREYTVIGPAVNKGARLIITYRNKLTCDKETFLRSKLDPDYFKLMEAKPMKGIANPGPIYEFTERKKQLRQTWRHPLLGRNEEMRIFQNVYQNAVEQQDRFTRYRDHKFAVSFIGPTGVGKNRIVEECITVTPSITPVVKLKLSPDSINVPFSLIRLINIKTFTTSAVWITRNTIENKLRYSLNMTVLTPLQIYALNTVFDCGFLLPREFKFTGDLFKEMSVKELIQQYFKSCFPSMTLMVVKHMCYTDDYSWRMLLWLLDTKKIFMIMTFINEEQLSNVARDCLSKEVIVKINLSGLHRYYHASLACQLLHVSAIPVDLEKVIQTASNGMAGWIQNYVISLVQSGQLSTVAVSRNHASELGAVIPPINLLLKADDVNIHDGTRRSQDISLLKVNTQSDEISMANESEIIQMAVLTDLFNIEDIKGDMSMDAVILKTYDSLKPFEKMLLKCASVLGDVFSRRMLVHLLQCDLPRKVALAVERLFSIRVLECEGGDFTRDSSYVMIHSAPTTLTGEPIHCACLGTRQDLSCRDLPMYAFCGYMKFKNPHFRTTMYELLTERQKDLAIESKEVRRIREQIAAFAGETQIAMEVYGNNEVYYKSDDEISYPEQNTALRSQHQSVPALVSDSSMRSINTIHNHRKSYELPLIKDYSDLSKCRSFSSLHSSQCECLAILLSSYYQIIDHCKGAGEYDSLIEAYLEYADLSIINQNIPQAIRLLFEVEEFIKAEDNKAKNQTLLPKPLWVKKLTIARIYSLRAACMLQCRDLNEAEKQLMSALILVYNPFPMTKQRQKCKYLTVSFEQLVNKIAPYYNIGSESGVEGQFYEEIADILNKLYIIFRDRETTFLCNLSAMWALNYALRTNANFRLLCTSYGNMITVYRHQQKFSACAKLQRQAMDFCARKRGPLDKSESQAVCHLYTSIFLFNVELGKKQECLTFGLTVMTMLNNLTDLEMRQNLVLWISRILLSDSRIHDVVAVMKEFFYLSDHYDLSAQTWYYCFSIVILLDSGYCIETYDTCEKFYNKHGLLRSRTPDSAWHFCVEMWLVTIRTDAWEKSTLWEEKINRVLHIKFKKDELSVTISLRLTEGFLINLVREMDKRNIESIKDYEKTIKSMFKINKKACSIMPLFYSRYYLLLGYFNFIKGRKVKAFNLLDQAYAHSAKLAHGLVQIWIDHTRSHWNGTLNPKLETYWVDHIEDEACLNLKVIDSTKKNAIVPYTLPLPKDLRR